jgi:hypothetical protein
MGMFENMKEIVEVEEVLKRQSVFDEVDSHKLDNLTVDLANNLSNFIKHKTEKIESEFN